MTAAMAGPGFAATCPCSTVHRLRMADVRKDYEARRGVASFGSGRSRRSMIVSAKKDDRRAMKDDRRAAAGKKNPEVRSRGFSRRTLVGGLVALVSPALLLSGGARSDVPHIDESEQMRLDMLQSIEKRIAASTPSTTAPALSKETTAAQASKTSSSASQSPEAVAPSSPVPEVSDTVSSSKFEDLPVDKKDDPQVVANPTSTTAEEEVVAAATGIEETSGAPGFLNFLGVVGSGILGAMYWLEGRAKAASNLALTEASTKLKESQAALEDLKSTYALGLADERSDLMRKLTTSAEEGVELRNEVTLLKSDAKEMLLQFESQNNVNRNLDKRVKEFKGTIQTLESRLQAVDDKLVHEEQKRQGLETEVRNSGVQIRKRDEKIVGLEGTIEALESRLQAMDDKLVHEEQKRQALETEVRNSAVQIRERDEKIVGLETSVKELENTEQEVRSDLFTTKTALVDAEDRIQNLVKELIVSQSCFEERGDALHDLKERLAEATSRAEEAEQIAAITQQELTEIHASSKEQLQVVNAALASKEDEVQVANLELDAAHAEAKQSSLVIENYQQHVEELEQTVAREQEAMQSLKEEFNLTIQNLRTKTTEASSLADELKNYQKELESLRKQEEENEAMLGAKLRSLRESLQEEQLVTSQLKQELDSTRTSTMEMKSLNEKLKETSLVTKKIQEELEDVRQTADGTLALLNDEKKKVALAEQQRIEMQKSLAREESLVQSLRSEFSKAMDAMNDLRKHLNSLSKDLQDANVKVASLETENTILQDALSKEKSVARKFKDKASLVESELAKMVQEQEGSISKARKLEDELAAADKEMGKLKQQMVVMGSVIDSAETRMGSIQQVNSEVAKSLARNFETVSSNVEQKQTLKRQVDKLKEQLKAASGITKELKNMKKLLNHFQQNLNEAEMDRIEAEAALQAAVETNTG